MYKINTKLEKNNHLNEYYKTNTIFTQNKIYNILISTITLVNKLLKQYLRRYLTLYKNFT